MFSVPSACIPLFIHPYTLKFFHSFTFSFLHSFIGLRESLDDNLPAKLGKPSETKGRGKSTNHGFLTYENNRSSGPNNNYHPGTRGGFRAGRGRGARGYHN